MVINMINIPMQLNLYMSLLDQALQLGFDERLKIGERLKCVTFVLLIHPDITLFKVQKDIIYDV